MNPLSLELEVQKVRNNHRQQAGILKNIYLNYAKKASMQLNAIGRLQRFMGKEQKEALIKSFILSNINYCPLV